MPPPDPPEHTLGAAAAAAVTSLASPPDLGRLVGVQESVCVGRRSGGEMGSADALSRLRPFDLAPPLPHSLFRLRAARAALAKLDTPEAATAVKTATEEIVTNAALLNAARADLEDVFRRAR